MEDGSMRGLLYKVFSGLSALSLAEALRPIAAARPEMDVERMVRLASKKARQLEGAYGHVLTEEERAAIVLYTMEGTPREDSVSD
jgi:hypothetical protein